MSYACTEIKFKSRDDKNTVSAVLYTPKSAEVRGIIQIAHGMVDHIGRYKNIADYFCKRAYVVAGNDHLGHGKTAENEGDYGYFAKNGGVGYVIRDMHKLNRILRETYRNVPIVMLGHSMGSFLCRLYAVKYPHTLAGVIIHGTAGRNPLSGVARLLSSLIILFRGDKYRSKLLKSVSTGSYHKHFPKEEGASSWLTADTAELCKYKDDPYTSFTFTVSGYRDLFTMLSESNSRAWFQAYPKGMPTLIMSGEDDPVGNFGKGVNQVYKQLLVKGALDLELKLYPDARHELFNELKREEYFADILTFTERVIKR